MATKKTCYCIGDLEERRKEIESAIDIIQDIERLKSYWMTEDTTGDLTPCPGFETKIRMYNEIIKSIIESYG